MRAYSIVDLLVGQYYKPTSLARRFQGGIINFAEKRQDSVWAGEDYEVFVVRYKPDNSITDKWATIAVRVSDY